MRFGGDSAVGGGVPPPRCPGRAALCPGGGAHPAATPWAGDPGAGGTPPWALLRALVHFGVRPVPWCAVLPPSSRRSLVRVCCVSLPRAGASGQPCGVRVLLVPRASAGVSAAARRPPRRGWRDSRGPSPRRLTDLCKANQQMFKKWPCG